MRLGTTRNPALTLILILLTCGLYYLYFIYIVSEETQELGRQRTHVQKRFIDVKHKDPLTSGGSHLAPGGRWLRSKHTGGHC